MNITLNFHIYSIHFRQIIVLPVLINPNQLHIIFMKRLDRREINWFMKAMKSGSKLMILTRYNQSTQIEKKNNKAQINS
jgi:hypothetical protein